MENKTSNEFNLAIEKKCPNQASGPIGRQTMNHRQRVLAVLKGDYYDRLPIVHFGFWRRTLVKWALGMLRSRPMPSGISCAIIANKCGKYLTHVATRAIYF